MASINKRLDDLQNALYPADQGAGLVFIWREDDEPLYTDCMGQERQYFSLEDVLTLYPRAAITDFRWINEAVREAKRRKAADPYAGTIHETWWKEWQDEREAERRAEDEQDN